MICGPEVPLEDHSWVELRDTIWVLTADNPRFGPLVAELEERGWATLLTESAPVRALQFVAIPDRVLDYS